MCYGESKYLWRQVLVMSAGALHSASISFMLSFPAVINPAILNPDSTDIRGTPDQASWIAASNGISAIFGFIFQSYCMEKYGRRIDYLISNLLLVISWIIFSFATNVATLITARVIQGISCGGLFINSLIISEYSDPSRRGYFMSIKKCVQAFGVLSCHGLTLCCDWRQISGIATAPAALSLIITLFWPESPSFLALKGKFEECEKSFTWLHGSSPQRRLELQELIKAQKERAGKEKQMTIMKQLRDRIFWKSFFIMTVVTLTLETSGKYYVVAYIIHMMKEIVGDDYIATYCAIGADVLCIVALIASSFVVKTFKRRTGLFIIGGFAVLIMFAVALISLLNTNVVWLMPSVMLLHFFLANASIIPICYTLFGELIPLEFRGIGTCLSGMVMTMFYAVTMKLTPILIQHTGVGGTYGTYGLCLLLCFIFLYFKMPETKDKTLQEIDDELFGVQRGLVELKPMLENKSL